jgi:hypothetical protein
LRLARLRRQALRSRRDRMGEASRALAAFVIASDSEAIQPF